MVNPILGGSGPKGVLSVRGFDSRPEQARAATPKIPRVPPFPGGPPKAASRALVFAVVLVSAGGGSRLGAVSQDRQLKDCCLRNLPLALNPRVRPLYLGTDQSSSVEPASVRLNADDQPTAASTGRDMVLSTLGLSPSFPEAAGRACRPVPDRPAWLN
jgi:hypothetical protein